MKRMGVLGGMGPQATMDFEADDQRDEVRHALLEAHQEPYSGCRSINARPAAPILA